MSGLRRLFQPPAPAPAKPARAPVVARPPPPPPPPPRVAPANTRSSFSAGPGRAPVNLEGGSVPAARPGSPVSGATSPSGITGANALRTLNYDRAVPGAVAHLSKETYAPEGNGSMLSDTLARRAITGGTDRGTDNAMNCVEACAESQDYFASEHPPVDTEIVVSGDHAVLRMPDGRYFDPTKVMNGNAQASPFLSSAEAAPFQGVDGITVGERREMEAAAQESVAKLGPNATPEQREQAAIQAARGKAAALGETGALDRANDGTVDPNALAAADRATVEQVYQEEGSAAAAQKMLELSEEHQDVPGYTDALIRESKPILDAIGVDLSARVTSNEDDDGEVHTTQDTLTALSGLADNAGPEGQAILGDSLASPLPDDGELNQFDDAFTELKEDGKGDALGGAVINSLNAQGKGEAAKGLEENVKPGTWKTETNGVEVNGSYSTKTDKQPTQGTEQKPEVGPDGKPVKPQAQGSIGFENSAETTMDSGMGIEGSGSLGVVDVEGHVSGPKLTMGASSSASVSKEGIEVKAEVQIDATVAEAGASGEVKVPVNLPGGERIEVTVKLGADAKIGATGTLNLDIKVGLDGEIDAKVSGSGFVGATGTLSGEVTIEHNGDFVASGKVSLTGAAGAGASGEAGVKTSGDQITFYAKGDAVGGFGGGISFEGSVDVSAAANMVTDVGTGLVRAGFEESTEFVADSGELIWNGTAAVGGAFWDGTQWVGETTWDGVKWVGGEAEDLANSMLDATGDAASKVWDGVQYVVPGL